MLKKIDFLNGVKSFETDYYGNLFFIEANAIYQYPNRKSILESSKNLQDLKSGEEFLFANDVYGKGFYIGADQKIVYVDEFISAIAGFYLISFKRIDGIKNIYITNIYDTNESYEIKDSSTIFFITRQKFVKKDFDKDLILVYNFPTSESLWEFSISSLKKQYQESIEIQNFLGVWKNELLVAIKPNIILSLDIETGAIVRQWQEIPGFIFDSEIKGVIPRSESFVLDGDKLVGALYLYYFEIDLISGQIKYVNLKKELDRQNIISIKVVHDNPVTEDHLFLTAMMRKSESDTKFSYDCIIALNKNTLTIDWHYAFEESGLGTNIPKLAGNKLYQLDTGGTLHIFEKYTAC